MAERLLACTHWLGIPSRTAPLIALRFGFARSRTLIAVDKLFLGWVGLGLLIPAVLGGWLTESWIGVVRGLLWGGLVRVFFVHHVTWSVNSIGHLWGSRPHDSNDQSRNNYILGILAFGEGWHNSHHAFPTSARHGLKWWQPDLSYFVIRLLAILGLAWNVPLPPKGSLSRVSHPDDIGGNSENKAIVC